MVWQSAADAVFGMEHVFENKTEVEDVDGGEEKAGERRVYSLGRATKCALSLNKCASELEETDADTIECSVFEASQMAMHRLGLGIFNSPSP